MSLCIFGHLHGLVFWRNGETVLNDTPYFLFIHTSFSCMSCISCISRYLVTEQEQMSVEQHWCRRTTLKVFKRGGQKWMVSGVVHCLSCILLSASLRCRMH